jgi:pSer/pThr/pTyr-binding forkhead associated (FHA) protein
MPADQFPSGPDRNVPAPAAAGANIVAADAAAAPAPADAATTAPADQQAMATPADQQAAPAPVGARTLTITFPSGQSYTLQDESIDVGRADVAQNWHPGLDVIPYGGGAPDLGVSRHHARIVRQDGGFSVIDLGSTNGTYINGHAAAYNQPAALNDGDTLSFGALNTTVAIK